MSRATQRSLGRLHLGLFFMVLVALLPAIVAGVAWAGSTADPGVDWQVLSGGGAPAVSGSGHVALNGSLGQTAIGPAAGSGYALGAGYWYGLGHGRYQIYLPLLLRNH